MSKTIVLTARIDEALSAKLNALAAKLDRSRAWVAAAAIEDYVTRETEFFAFLQEGIDDLENGRWISHEDLMHEIEERHGGKRAA